MKKLFALLSLAAFLAVSVNAQEPKAAAPSEVKKEASVAKSDVNCGVKASAGKSCCMKDNKACCKNNHDSKNCTAEQKAACAKAGKECSHAKADASETKENKSGLK